VVLFERAPKAGGLLRFGIPEFKMEKRVLERRIEQMEAEGTEFRCGVNVGVDITAEQLREEFDAIVLSGGSTIGRDLPIPGRELRGIHLAMEFLTPSNMVQEGMLESSPISARDKHVIIIGGGDTGADCLGTAHRQGALDVHQLEILPQPPLDRGANNPWPQWPMIFRTSSAHEEGGERLFSVNTDEFVGDDSGNVRALRGRQVQMVFKDGRPNFEPVEGTEFELKADLVLLAMGFVGPQREGLLEQLGVEFDARGNVARDDNFMTNVPGVFVAGDMGRGQSLIVWAIAEGRSAAACADVYLGADTLLPKPLLPSARPL
jgi:glutamate synthase (NADPH/NADH) small chain